MKVGPHLNNIDASIFERLQRLRDSVLSRGSQGHRPEDQVMRVIGADRTHGSMSVAVRILVHKGVHVSLESSAGVREINGVIPEPGGMPSVFVKHTPTDTVTATITETGIEIISAPSCVQIGNRTVLMAEITLTHAVTEVDTGIATSPSVFGI